MAVAADDRVGGADRLLVDHGAFLRLGVLHRIPARLVRGHRGNREPHGKGGDQFDRRAHRVLQAKAISLSGKQNPRPPRSPGMYQRHVLPVSRPGAAGSVPPGQCRAERDERKSISASSTPEVTKVRCTRIRHPSSVSLSGSLPILMKARNSAIAEIATIDETSFNFSAEKSTLPIQAGRSARSSASNRDTKFS